MSDTSIPNIPDTHQDTPASGPSRPVERQRDAAAYTDTLTPAAPLPGSPGETDGQTEGGHTGLPTVQMGQTVGAHADGEAVAQADSQPKHAQTEAQTDGQRQTDGQSQQTGGQRGGQQAQTVAQAAAQKDGQRQQTDGQQAQTVAQTSGRADGQTEAQQQRTQTVAQTSGQRDGGLHNDGKKQVKRKMSEADMLASIPGGGGHGRIIPIRTAERAREVVARRWDRVREARRLGVAMAAGQSTDMARFGYDLEQKFGRELAMIAHISEAHALNAADPSARGSAASARLVFEAYEPERRHTDSGVPSGLACADEAELRELLAAWRAWRARRAEGGGQ